MLPTSRNTTYAIGSQVKSADLNALQDCIIQRRFPLTGYVIPAASFAKVSGAATYSDATGRWVGVGTFIAALPAIPGTLIDSIEWGHARGGNGNMSFRARAKNVRTGAQTSTIILHQVSVGSAYDVATIQGADIDAAGIPDAIAVDSAVSILIEHDHAANGLGGIIAHLSRL